MVIILDRKSLESALPDVPRRVVMALIAADVRGQQPVHPATEVAVSRGPDDQVEMIGHQAEGQHPHRHPRLASGSRLTKAW